MAGAPLLRGLLVAGWLYWTANAALTALLVPFVAGRHGSGAVVGWLVAGLGVGHLGGALLSRRLVLRFPARALLAAGYAAVGVAFLVLFTASSVAVALVAVTAAGVPGAVALVVSVQRVQMGTGDAVRGRVVAAFQAGDALAALTGAVLGPAVAVLFGLAAALPALCGLLLLAAVVAARLPAEGSLPVAELASTGREEAADPVYLT
ncbi:MFS transporter [Micromonospora sp. B11E3]|uniref:MFS transporter n=1 Tax=Micromonospora sp. B11E3 TaxID=3153562 RepID=UPI00325CBA59